MYTYHSAPVHANEAARVPSRLRLSETETRRDAVSCTPSRHQLTSPGGAQHNDKNSDIMKNLVLKKTQVFIKRKKERAAQRRAPQRRALRACSFAGAHSAAEKSAPVACLSTDLMLCTFSKYLCSTPPAMAGRCGGCAANTAAHVAGCGAALARRKPRKQPATHTSESAISVLHTAR